MGCPFHQDDGEESGRSDSDGDPSSGDDASGRGIDRRAFVKSALAIGGTSALTQLERVAGMQPEVTPTDHAGISAAARLNRQHAWDAFEPTTATGNTRPPHNSLFLCMDYQKDGVPAPGHRKQVEAALTEIEHYFQWRPSGVMFTMAYSMPYFERFDEELPPGAKPFTPERVADLAETVTTDESVVPDTHEVVLLLASDNAANLLAVESALWGEDNQYDIDFDATFEGIFDKPESFPDRRVGFIGPDLPKDEYEDELDVEIPAEAPLSMGFVAGFGASIPREDVVTLVEDQQFPSPEIDDAAVPDEPYIDDVGPRDPGVFAQGTLKHLSHIILDLEDWYDKPQSERRAQIYSPFHTEDDVGIVGEHLTEQAGGQPGAKAVDDEDVPDLSARSTTEPDYAEQTEQTAAEGTELTDDVPTLGHSQKAARARYDIDGDGELEQPVLRRDWDGLTTLDDPTAGYQFNVPMRFNESAFSMFDANYNLAFSSLDGRIDHDPVDTDQWRHRNGIAPFMEATTRGHFLVPPITVRALPTPQPESVALDVERDGDQYVVTVIGGAESDGGSGDGDSSPPVDDPPPLGGSAAERSAGGVTTQAIPDDPPPLGGGDDDSGDDPPGNGGSDQGNGPPEDAGGGPPDNPGNGPPADPGNGNGAGPPDNPGNGPPDNTGGQLDPETARFGTPKAVNQARGATPQAVSENGDYLTFRFAVDEVAADDEVKFFAKRENDLVPVVGRTTL